MERFVTGFIRASLVWLAIGGLLGLAMVFWPGSALAYRPAHLHATLLGFVSMMIFGVAYHVIPRFCGNPLHSRVLPRVHLWIANLGLAGMVAGWVMRIPLPAIGAPVVGAGALLAAGGTGLFIYNIWRTLDGAGVRLGAPATAPSPPPIQLGMRRRLGS
jgi:hypothetical protein